MGISESRTVRTNYNTNFQSIIVKVPNLKQVEIKDKLNSWAKPYKKYIIEPRINYYTSISGMFCAIIIIPNI